MEVGAAQGHIEAFYSSSILLFALLLSSSCLRFFRLLGSGTPGTGRPQGWSCDEPLLGLTSGEG